MSFLTKASLATRFQTGDKPTQSDFQDLIDTVVAIPSGASFPAFISVESTVANSARPVGAVGAQIVAATATSQLTNMLDIPASVAHTTFGRALVSAANTAAAQSILGITSAGSFGATLIGTGTTAAAQSLLGVVSAGVVGTNLIGAGTTAAAQRQLDLDRDVITGFILSPIARGYILDQRARFPMTIDWIAARVSAGHCAVTLLTESSAVIASAAVDTTEAAASGTNTLNTGETLTLRVSDVSSPNGLAFTIGITRT